MIYSCFDLDIADGVAHLQLKRGAELNTMTREFWRKLPEIVRDIDADAPIWSPSHLRVQPDGVSDQGATSRTEPFQKYSTDIDGGPALR